jgi:hypothetical protein
MQIVTTLVLVSLLAGSGQDALIGKWHGSNQNLPVVDLDIEQHSGTAAFYLMKRNADGSNLHVEGPATSPMEDVNLTPDKLAFTVHRKDGTVVAFRVVLDDANHATLTRVSDNQSFPLTRVSR